MFCVQISLSPAVICYFIFSFLADEDAGKATSPLTPDFVREDIKMRGGVGSHGWLNIDGGLGLGQLLRSSLQRQQQQRQQQSAQQAHGFGHSASFQLLPEEVVVVAGNPTLPRTCQSC